MNSNAAIFGATGAGTVNVSGTQTVTALSTGTTYAFSGGQIALASSTTPFALDGVGITVSLSSPIAGSGMGLVKTGVATASLTSSSNSYSGPTVVAGGFFQVTSTGRLLNTSALTVTGNASFYNGDATSNASNNNGVTNRINSAATLTLGGTLGSGGFRHSAAAANATHDQSLVSLSLGYGLNSLDTTSATGTASLTFTGAGSTVFSRTAGGMLNIVPSTGFRVAFTNQPASLAGSGTDAILPGVTIGTNDFVSLSGAGPYVAGTASYTPTSTTTWSSGKNMDVTGTLNLSGSTAVGVNSIRFGAATPYIVTLPSSGTTTIASGMILNASTSSTSAITGGTITSGYTNSSGVNELMIYDRRAVGARDSNGFSVTSAIVDNGATAVAVTVTGSTNITSLGGGSVILGSNDYSGGTTLVGAAVKFSSDTAFGRVPETPGVNIRVTSAGGYLRPSVSATLSHNRTIEVNNGVLVLDPAGASTGGFVVNGQIIGSGTLGMPTNAYGTLVLNGSSSLTGAMETNNGIVRAAEGVGLSSGVNLRFGARNDITGGGYLQLSGTFSRPLGTSSGAVQWGTQFLGSLNDSGGFTAFGGPLTVALGGTGSLNTFTWNSTTVKNTSKIFLQDAGATAVVTWLNPIDLASGTRTVGVASTSQFAELAGQISNGGLTKSDVGTLRLTGSNTYAGATTVSGGTLQIGGNGTSGALNASSPVSVASGAALAFARTDDYGGAFANTISGSGSVRVMSGLLAFSATNTYTGTTTLAGGVLRLNDANALPGGIGATGGTSNLTFNGGVLGLGTSDTFARGLAAASTGSAAATFTGAGGFAAYGGDRVVNLGGVTGTVTWATANTGFNGQTLILGATSATGLVDLQNPLELGNAARTVQVDDSPSVSVEARLSGVISGSSSSGLLKVGAGALELTGLNTFAGPVTIGAGAIAATAIGNSGANGPLGTSGTVNLGTSTTVGTLRYTGAGETSNRVFNLSGTTGSGGAIEANGSGPLVVAGGVTAAAGDKTLTLAGTNPSNNSIGAISNPSSNGSIAVLKQGAGRWVLSGSSSYTGSTTVAQGELVLGVNATGTSSNGALGLSPNATIMIGSATGSGTAALLLKSGVTIDSRALTIPGGSQQTVLGGVETGGTATFGSGNNMTVDLGRDVTLQAATGGTVVFNNAWTATAGFARTIAVGSSGNAGTVQLGSVLGTTAAVNVNSGTLRLGITGALPSASAINIGVAGASSAEVNYAASGETIDRPVFALGNGRNRIRNSGAGTLVLSGSLTKNGTILELAGGTFTVSGQITGASDNSDLYVNGATVTLSNTNNNYVGPTYVYGGGTLVLGASNVIPTNSALTLGGTGSDTGTGTINTGLFSDTIASLTSSSLGSTVSITGSGATMGGLTTTGNVTFGAGTDTLALTISSSLTLGKYQLLTYQGLLSGTFDSVGGLTDARYNLVYGSGSNSSIDLQMRATQAAALPYTQPTSGTVSAFVTTNVSFSGTLANTTPTGGATLAVSLTGTGGQLTVGSLAASTGSTVAAGSAATITGQIATGTTLGSRSWTVVNTDTSALTSTTATASGVVNVFAHGTPTLSGTTINLGNVLVGSTASQLLTVSNGVVGSPVANTGGITWTASSTPSGFGTGGLSQPGVVASGSGVNYTYGLVTGSAGSFTGSQTFTFADDTSILGGGSLGGLTVSLTGTVYDPATASLASGGSMAGNAWTINLGEFNQGAGTSTPWNFSISNLLASGSFTADLMLSSFALTGDSGAIFMDLTGTSSFTTLAAGQANLFTAWMSLANTGTFANTYQLNFTSAKNNQSLGGSQNVTLTVTGIIVVPEPGTIALAIVGVALVLGMSARRRTSSAGRR